MERKIRVLVGKLGLDGHDRGAKLVARKLRDAGMEVIYTGYGQTPQQIASTALQEDVDVIGLSFLCGAHIELTQKLTDQLEGKGLHHILLLVGGTIPPQDIPKLRAIGVEGVFPTGSSLGEAVDLIHRRTSKEKV